eukprot:g64194.t1
MFHINTVPILCGSCVLCDYNILFADKHFFILKRCRTRQLPTTIACILGRSFCIATKVAVYRISRPHLAFRMSSQSPLAFQASFKSMNPQSDMDVEAIEVMLKPEGGSRPKSLALLSGLAVAAVSGALIYHFAPGHSPTAAGITKVSAAADHLEQPDVDFGNGCNPDECQLLSLANPENPDFPCKTFTATAVLDSFLLDEPLNLQVSPLSDSVCASAQGEIVPIDTELHLRFDPVNTASGCSPGDFVGFPTGGIALIQRGGCFFVEKALNAEAAGASGVIIFNQGNSMSEERNGLPCAPGESGWGLAFMPGTCALNGGLSIPVVGTSFENGMKLSVLGGKAKISVSKATNAHTLSQHRTDSPRNTQSQLERDYLFRGEDEYALDSPRVRLSLLRGEDSRLVFV